MQRLRNHSANKYASRQVRPQRVSESSGTREGLGPSTFVWCASNQLSKGYQHLSLSLLLSSLCSQTYNNNFSILHFELLTWTHGNSAVWLESISEGFVG